MSDEIKIVVEICCAKWNVTYSEMFAKGKKSEAVAMRQCIIYIIRRKYPRHTFLAISQALWQRPLHNTSYNAYSKALELVAVKDLLFMKYYNQVKHLLNE